MTHLNPLDVLSNRNLDIVLLQRVYHTDVVHNPGMVAFRLFLQEEMRQYGFPFRVRPLEFALQFSNIAMTY